MYQYRGAENGLKGCKTYAMQTDVAILISEKVDFKTRDIIRDKKNSYFWMIVISSRVHNNPKLYAPNDRSLKFMK